jgi:hypothetical protein
MSESAGSTGRAIVASAVLICAALLMACPAVIAVISMLDPAALTQASLWLEHLSPAVSVVNYAKAAVLIGSVVAVWGAEKSRGELQTKSRPPIALDGAVRTPGFRKVLPS